MTSCIHKMSNKHEKGYNSRKNQPSVKSVQYVHLSFVGFYYYTPTRRVVGILEYPCPFIRP
jgi:hypothetical protein